MQKFSDFSKGFMRFIFIFFVFLMVFLVVSEITLRGINYSYIPLRIKRLGKAVPGMYKSDWRSFHLSEDEYFVYDPNLIWRPKKSYKLFNAQGFRGPELSAIKEDEYRIFTIGDSNTLGPMHEPGWVEFLGGTIEKSHPEVRVVNAGAWGYSSWQGLKRFEEILHYNPDMVLISFGANDAHRVTIPDKAYVASKSFFNSKIAKFRISQLFISISDLILMKNNEDNLLVPRVSLDEYKDYLVRMITLAKKKDIKVILLTRPFIGTSHHELWWKNFAPQYNKLTMRIAKERGVSVIDIYSLFKDKGEYFPEKDECHFNEEGHRRAAKIIYEKIKEVL